MSTRRAGQLLAEGKRWLDFREYRLAASAFDEAATMLWREGGQEATARVAEGLASAARALHKRTRRPPWAA